MSFADKSIQRIPFSHTSLNHPCIHSLQSVRSRFLHSLHPFLPCTGRRCMDNSLACRMFSCSCTVSGYPCPTFSSVPTVLQNRSQSFFFLSLPPTEHSPRTCDPHHLFPFISTSSSTYHYPPQHPTRSNYYLSFPPTSSRLISHPPFHNQSTQQLCIFLAILFLQFYCTTCFIHLLTTPKVLRCPYITVATKARSVALSFPSHSLRVVVSGIWE